jgi:hypothetical protein
VAEVSFSAYLWDNESIEETIVFPVLDRWNETPGFCGYPAGFFVMRVI